MTSFLRMALCAVLILPWCAAAVDELPPGLYSIETGYTITKVRSAKSKTQSYIVASSYEGAVLAIDYSGQILWENRLSGYVNHDIWSEDITGDGVDEILTANADGNIYCLDDQGMVKWTFKKNDAPMNSVAVVRVGWKPYIVVGGYDRSFYYLNSAGRLVKEIKSSTYSQERLQGRLAANEGLNKRGPASFEHSVNFIRRLRQKDGSYLIAVHGTFNSSESQGAVYLFEPLGEQPISVHPLTAAKTAVGDMRVIDIDGDGADEILLGSSENEGSNILRLDLTSGNQKTIDLASVKNDVDRFGYRVAQVEVVPYFGSYRYLVLFGSQLLLVPPSMNASRAEVLSSRYSFNDMWRDPDKNLIILASSQSGGSAVHIIDMEQPDWKELYQDLQPPGKISRMLANTDKIRNQVQRYRRPSAERVPLPVYLMSDVIGTNSELVDRIRRSYSSPVFLGYKDMPKVEKWERSGLANEFYQQARDPKRSYSLTSKEVLNAIESELVGNPGVSYWGGNGNDPYMISLRTEKRIVNSASGNGKQTVMIYPELTDYNKDTEFMLSNLIYPLAQHSKGKNAKIFLRNKHTFWQSIVYKRGWSRLVSGEFADVFVPSMEETTDKTMELSLAARLGLWSSGAVNDWGARFARDNTSYDRLRQHSHQMVPNHALRQLVYNIAYGARYINNDAVDQEYLSVLWDLIGKGALYVPRRDQIVSFSPVHLSMKAPDKLYLQEGNSSEWTALYDAKFEKKYPMVFSRLNGTWPGAPVAEWDFSSYAAGVKDRRLNYLPPFSHGLVLITPPQAGKFAAKNPKRGLLQDQLHPIYKTILTEYITDGRKYYSHSGTEALSADGIYLDNIKSDIEAKAKLLPLTVSGDVAWVVAQTGPKHLRLTLIDSGYINPKRRVAHVSFNTVRPAKIKDILDGEIIDRTNLTDVQIPVPLGSFRFIDIELSKPL